MPEISGAGGAAPGQTPARPTHIVVTGGPRAEVRAAVQHVAAHLTGAGWQVITTSSTPPDAFPERPWDAQWDPSVTVDLLLEACRRADVVAADATVATVAAVAADSAVADAVAARTVVLHPRGIPDLAAHLDPAGYAEAVAAVGLTRAGALGLYDAVVHLRAAAAGPDAAMASLQEDATLDAWANHPHLCIVGAGATAHDTLARTARTVQAILGDPEPIEAERKFALSGPPDLTHPVLANAAVAEIEQVYLAVDDSAEPASGDPGAPTGVVTAGTTERRVRARTVDGVTTYVQTRKVELGDGTRREVEQPISAEMYAALAQLRDPQTRPVRKTRRMFVVGDLRFELDEFHSPAGLWLLEVELLDLTEEVSVPDFLPPTREVTRDRQWRNRALAARS